MHYLIWIPDTHINPADTKLQTLERVGLADHVENAEAMPSAGPTGGQGVLFTWRKNSPMDFGYFADRQQWIPAAACDEMPTGRYWVGLWKDKPPTTKNLARPYLRVGPPIQLGDGQSWVIPKACELPETLKLQDDGSLKYVPLRNFHAFYVKACEMSRAIAAGAGVPYIDLFHFCTDALRINYRMTPEVASALDLFDKDNVVDFAYAVVGAKDG